MLFQIPQLDDNLIRMNRKEEHPNMQRLKSLPHLIIEEYLIHWHSITFILNVNVLYNFISCINKIKFNIKLLVLKFAFTEWRIF